MSSLNLVKGEIDNVLQERFKHIIEQANWIPKAPPTPTTIAAGGKAANYNTIIGTTLILSASIGLIWVVAKYRENQRSKRE